MTTDLSATVHSTIMAHTHIHAEKNFQTKQAKRHTGSMYIWWCRFQFVCDRLTVNEIWDERLSKRVIVNSERIKIIHSVEVFYSYPHQKFSALNFEQQKMQRKKQNTMDYYSNFTKCTIETECDTLKRWNAFMCYFFLIHCIRFLISVDLFVYTAKWFSACKTSSIWIEEDKKNWIGLYEKTKQNPKLKKRATLFCKLRHFGWYFGRTVAAILSTWIIEVRHENVFNCDGFLC